MAQCSAKCKSSGKRCQRRAVSNYAVCQVHGAGSIQKERAGGRPATHGRYSRLKRTELKEVIAAHEADPNPLNILPELAAARALFEDFANRYDDLVSALLAWNEEELNEAFAERRKPKPQRVPDLSEVTTLVSEITKIVQRIESIRAGNAISRKELHRILTEMTRVVELEVPDAETQKRIRNGWVGIRLA